MALNSNNLRFIMGLKLKQYRLKRGYSLKELAEKTGLSISYLSEIEKGKKYPKPEKILTLARALGVSFDTLVTLTVDGESDPIHSILSSPVVQEFPFRMFGVSIQDVLNLITESPEKVSALVRTFRDIEQSYAMRMDHLLLAALRAYQHMHLNYFQEQEEAVAGFLRENRWPPAPPVEEQRLREYVTQRLGYVIDEQSLAHYPELQEYRSVWVDGAPPRLLLNPRLSSSQKKFILAREIAFHYLNLTERPSTFSWLKLESFAQLLNNFKASYFAGALLMPREHFLEDVQRFFEQPRWDEGQFLALLHRYQVTPEMLFYRFSELLPQFFGIRDIFFLRFHHRMGSQQYQLTKSFNLSSVFNSNGIGFQEHHCRRWLSIRLLKQLAEAPTAAGAAPLLAAQRSRFIDSGKRVLMIAFARPAALNPHLLLSGTVGFLIDELFMEKVRFWDDPAIPEIEVNESCERCGLTPEQCADRAAPATIFHQQQELRLREKALHQLIRDVQSVHSKT